MLRPLLLVVATCAACQSAPPLRPVASARPAASAPAPSASAEPAPPDPLAAVRARGALHGEPIKIAGLATGRHPEDRWLVFVGSPDVARAAWIVTPGAEKNELEPVAGWPAGVRVVGSVVRQSVVYLLLETVKLLDQPAGLRAVWFDGFGNASPFTFAPESTFAGVRDVAELEKRVDAGPPARKAPPEGALMAALRAASKSEAALAAALASSGADVVDVWQQTFGQTLEQVDAQKLSASPRVAHLLDLVRAAVANDHCEADVCEAVTPRGHAQITLMEQSGKWVIREIAEDAAVAPASPAAAPHAVAASATTTSTEQVLREHVRTSKHVLGEAPLGGANAAATIGVAITDFDNNGPAIVLHDGDYTRVFSLSSMTLVDANTTDTRFEARFADVDGDGRTDAIVRATGTSMDGTPLAFAQAFLAPPASVQTQDLLADHATELALLGATSVDAAMQAALAVPARGVALADACKVLLGTSALPAFRKASVADVRVLTFEEPTMPTYRARVTTESRLRPEDVRDCGKRCSEMECSGTRPVCVYTDGPYSEVYWFAWDGGNMRLAGAAFYQGT